ncbi:MAG: RidA family protein [Pseudomonadota bacterium]
MIAKVLVLGGLLLAAPAFGHAAEVTRSYASPQAVIAGSVTVPAGYDTVYFSGVLPAVADPAAGKGTIASYGDTETQTASVLARINEGLKAHGLGPADVVKMTVFLVGDPAAGGKLDFAGMMRAYGKIYGTAEQPNRPARSTVQVAGLAGPGFLVEIEVIAAKPPKAIR